MAIERITITIKKDLLGRVDRNIGGEIRSRSHAIENLLLKALSKTDLDTVLILAGGDGARLRPITYEIPKPLIPIHGRPILEHQINMLKQYDIRNIFVACNSPRVEEYFGNGSKFGVKITYLEEEKPMGTAGAISLMKDYTKNTFGVLNVDTLINPNIPEICEFHKNQGGLGTVLLATAANTAVFGVVRMRGSHIVDFIEKPKSSESNLVNAGFYVFEPGIAKLLKGHKMIESEFKNLAKKGHLKGFVHDGPVFDVGTHAGYERAIKQWKDIK